MLTGRKITKENAVKREGRHWGQHIRSDRWFGLRGFGSLLGADPKRCSPGPSVWPSSQISLFWPSSQSWNPLRSRLHLHLFNYIFQLQFPITFYFLYRQYAFDRSVIFPLTLNYLICCLSWSIKISELRVYILFPYLVLL